MKDLRRGADGGRLAAGSPWVDAPAPRPRRPACTARSRPKLGDEPRLVVERAPGHTPGMEYDLEDGAVLGRGEQAEIRLEDPFASSRHARIIRQGGVMVLEDLGSTNGTYLNEEILGGPDPAAPRRSRADRRQRVHLRRLMLRVAEKADRTDPGVVAPHQRGQLLLALAPVRDRRRHGRRAGRRGRLAPRRSRSSRTGCPTPAARAEERLAGTGRRRPTRASTSCRSPTATLQGMGTTTTAAYVDENDIVARARRRQPRLPAARGRAAAPDRRPHARRGVRAPGQAHARGGRRPPAALDHHPRAGARARGRGRPLQRRAAATATCSCSAATA